MNWHNCNTLYCNCINATNMIHLIRKKTFLMLICIFKHVWNPDKIVYKWIKSDKTECPKIFHERQKIVQRFRLLDGKGASLPSHEERIASSNTSLIPFCLRAEHSIYLTAPIFLATALPWYLVIGERLWVFKNAIVLLSSRKSILVPTRMMGVSRLKSVTSGNHC